MPRWVGIGVIVLGTAAMTALMCAGVWGVDVLAHRERISRYNCTTPAGDLVKMQITGAAHIEVMGCTTIVEIGRKG